MNAAPLNDYGVVVSIDAEAVGMPGQRTFRLVARSEGACASVWMEKEQISGIGEWLGEVVERLDEEQPSPEPDVAPLPPPETFDLDFKAGQISLGYIEEDELFTIQAFAPGDDPQADPALFRCYFSRGQSRVLSQKIEVVVAAGRPVCPFCQEPMDPAGHACPRENGHKDTAVP